MAAPHGNPLLQHIRRLSGSSSEQASDGQLLERFLVEREEAAFAAVVRRHGPMVFGLCRRVLRNEQDAEDAFQATFLVLARKAASLRQQRSLGGWLHQVAYHLALRAKDDALRRLQHEGEVRPMKPNEEPAMEVSRRELRSLLDEELRQLPTKYREPLILCYLEGKTNEQAALQLGWPAGSMSRRLARGRELLRHRLLRRGVSLSAGVLAMALVEEAASAAMPPLLAASVVRMVLRTSAAGVSPAVAALVDGRIREMFHLKLRLALFVTLTVAGVGAGALAYQTKDKQPAEDKPAFTAKASDKQPRTDFYGDPLPPGALARLGTIRLRHIAASVAFSQDGKTLISAGADGMLRFWEPSTGKELRRVSVQAAKSIGRRDEVFSADGKTVVGLMPQNICVWETATGKELKRIPLEKSPRPGFENSLAHVGSLALSPDGNILAALVFKLRIGELQVWNVNTGKKLFTLEKQRDIDSLAFSSDGKLLGTVSSTEGLRLWDTTTGKEVRKIAGGWSDLAFSADGKWVAAFVWGGGAKVWNTSDGKEVFDLESVPEGFPITLAFAPDNKILAIGFPDEVVLCDVSSGKQLRSIPYSSGQFVFSPDSKMLAFAGTALRLWDVATGKEIGSRPGHDDAVSSLAIAPAGSSVATFGDRVVHVWDAASGRPLLHITAHNHYLRDGAFSPDGRFLVTGGDDNVLRLWDRKTGKELRQFTIESADPARENLQVMAVALSSDGERLISLIVSGDMAQYYQVYVWHIATGKKLARRSIRNAPVETRFSPDTRSMAYQKREEVIVEDTITGQELMKAAGRGPLAYSPDGQVLTLAHFKPKPLPPGTAGPAGGDPGDVDAVRLVELATGKQLQRIETGPVGHNLLAYSPDGRGLATADKEGFRLWDVATGKELFRRALPEKYRGSFGYSFFTSLAFLPSSDRLATGLMDSTVLIWDLEPKTWHAGLAVPDLAPRDLERLWADLAGEDATKAHQAVGTLAAVPTKAVPFLKEHLRPTAALDAKQVQRLIADLDSPEFAAREAAEKKLASFGEQAEPALRQALESKPSLEMRKRLEALHAAAELANRGIVHSAELLRTLRAIRVLEHIRDREAQQVLRMLADGDPAARAPGQAKDALRRLAKGLR